MQTTELLLELDCLIENIKTMSEDDRLIKEPQSDDDIAEEEDSGNVALMGNSGQTDEERRSIRRSQRQLFKEMEERAETLGVEEARKRNNKIFKSVKFTREAVLDGDNLTLIATKASQKVDRLVQVRF